MKTKNLLIIALAAGTITYVSCKKVAEMNSSKSKLSSVKTTESVTCTPASTASVATTYNTFFTRGDATTSQWTGSDATYSIPLGGGKILWMFGDTFVDLVNPPDATHPTRWRATTDKMNPNTFMIQNTSVTPNTWITVVGNGVDPVSWMWWPPAKTGNEYLTGTSRTWYWPCDATISGDNLYIFFSKFQNTTKLYGYAGTDMFTFSVSALKALTATVSQYTTAVTKTSVYTVATPIDSLGANFGAAILEDGTTNYMYISDFISYYPFGSWHAAKVYKVASSNINGTKSFLTGYGAAPNYTPTYGSTYSGMNVKSGIMQKLTGTTLSDLLVSPQFSVIKVGSKYRLITQSESDQTKIMEYESSSPVGPWSCETQIATLTIPAHCRSYNAFVHPEVTNGTNQYLLSYNLNGLTLADVYNNVDTYRAMFLWLNIPAN